MSANLGNELTPAQAPNEPKVQWPVKTGAYYMLYMGGKSNVTQFNATQNNNARRPDLFVTEI